MLITVGDLTDYMNLSLDTGATTAASAIIDGLEADLEAYVRRPLVPTEITAEVVRVDGRGKVLFKKTPVLSVASFSIDATVVSPAGYVVETWGLSQLSGVGLVSPFAAPPVLTASYVGGLPGDDPTDVWTRKARATLLRAAARDVNQVVRQDAAGVARLSVEGTAMDFHGGVKAGKGGLTEDEKAEFNRWKRRIVRA